MPLPFQRWYAETVPVVCLLELLKNCVIFFKEENSQTSFLKKRIHKSLLVAEMVM